MVLSVLKSVPAFIVMIVKLITGTVPENGPWHMYHVVHFGYNWSIWKQFFEHFMMLLNQKLQIRDLILAYCWRKYNSDNL
jgi:hypothetical protein